MENESLTHRIVRPDLLRFRNRPRSVETTGPDRPNQTITGVPLRGYAESSFPAVGVY
jgi:hypothetical protein